MNDYFDLILCKSDSRIYTNLFNLRSFLVGNNSKVFLGKNIYFLKEKGLKNIVYFFSKEIQGSYAYKFGLKSRAKKLSKEYLAKEYLLRKMIRFLIAEQIMILNFGLL